MAVTDKIPFKGKGIAFFIVLVVVGAIIMDGLVSIPAGHVGVVFDQGRGILEDELGEGLHLKIPVWQTVTVMDARTQEYTMSQASSEGDYYGDDSIEARSKDGQIVFIDATILYHIDKTKANLIKQNLGTKFEYNQKIVRPRSREKIREVVAKYNALDLVSENRNAVAADMNERLKESFATHNIVLEEVVLRNVTFSIEFASALEQKQVALEQVTIARYQKQQAEELKDKKIIEAQADAESIRIKGESLRANPEIIQLEFVEKLAPNIGWGILPDGALPLINLQN